MDQKDIEYQWRQKASRNIREKMIDNRLTYEELVFRLECYSVKYNVKQLQNKISRGTLTAGLYLLLDRVASGSNRNNS